MIHFPFGASNISSQCKELIIKNSKTVTFAENKIIYLQEDVADKFFIVLTGYVRLSYIMENGTAILYGIVPPGQCFGELGAFERSAYTDTASAVGSVTVLSVRANIFHSGCADNHELRSALSVLVASRYKAYIDVTKGLYLSHLSSRLATSLMRLAHSFNQTTEIKGRSFLYLGPMVTQSDLGAMARGTRGNVNRLLKKWERDGIILLQDRKIILLDPGKLEQISLGGGEEN
jgi:CRP/FNR family cyclic AMP-dependent transcriptional regulator